MSWVKDYFSFTRKERNGFLVLLFIIVGFLFLPNLYKPKNTSLSISTVVKDSFTAVPETPVNPTVAYNSEPRKQYELFYFNPNTIDEEGLIRLGLPPRTARTIINYRNKGGRFRSAEDIRKIYTLQEEDADRIIPYARVPASDEYYKKPYNTYTRKPYTVKAIDINGASVEDWISLPGIGESYSRRIVAFRERLGGFSSIQQVARTYNLPDSTFQKILPYLRLSDPVVNQIDINSAYENELLECAAMTVDLAKAIIIYRKQHGRYQELEDLKKIVFLTEEKYQELIPCLRVGKQD